MRRTLVALAGAAALVAFGPLLFGQASFGPASIAVAATPTPAPSPGAVLSVSSATLTFTASDMATAALLPSPTTAVSASLTFTTTAGGAGGSVTVNPVNLINVSGSPTLDERDFTLTCKRTGGSTGFIAASPATLNGPTACATLTQGKTNVTATFSIMLTLNDTTSATVPFEAASSYQGNVYGYGYRVVACAARSAGSSAS